MQSALVQMQNKLKSIILVLTMVGALSSKGFASQNLADQICSEILKTPPVTTQEISLLSLLRLALNPEKHLQLITVDGTVISKASELQIRDLQVLLPIRKAITYSESNADEFFWTWQHFQRDLEYLKQSQNLSDCRIRAHEMNVDDFFINKLNTEFKDFNLIKKQEDQNQDFKEVQKTLKNWRHPSEVRLVPSFIEFLQISEGSETDLIVLTHASQNGTLFDFNQMMIPDLELKLNSVQNRKLILFSCYAKKIRDRYPRLFGSLQSAGYQVLMVDIDPRLKLDVMPLVLFKALIQKISN
ncbi:MAG: hypothetical protein ACK5V3_12165 [Bdellovibrionales bacterium]